MKLVVVESPAKAKTIEKYLGPGHKVLASYGHVRDLPAKDGSVDPDHGFAMEWDTYPDKAKQLKAIADAAKTADALILATDRDQLVSFKAIARAAERLPHCELVRFGEEARHEILREADPVRLAALARIDAFIEVAKP